MNTNTTDAVITTNNDFIQRVNETGAIGYEQSDVEIYQRTGEPVRPGSMIENAYLVGVYHGIVVDGPYVVGPVEDAMRETWPNCYFEVLN